MTLKASATAGLVMALCVGCGDGGGTGGSEPGTECVRPTGYPEGHGYIGRPGDHGCDPEEACIIFPDREEGDCYGEDDQAAPCTIVGRALNEGLRGFSQHCDPEEATRAVCDIPANEWIGSCVPKEAPIELSGVLQDCALEPEARDELPFTVVAPEMVSFSLRWSTEEPASVNVVSTILEATFGEPFVLAGNNLEMPGSFAPDAPQRTFHAFGLGGDKLWEFKRIGGCAPVEYEAIIERVIPPLQNQWAAHATPLAKGVPITSHWGCSEALGEQLGSFRHYYRIRVDAGEPLEMSLSRSPVAPGGPTSDGLSATILTSTEQEVLLSGNPAGVSLGTLETASETFELDSGEYLIVLEGSACGPMLYTLSY